MLAASAADARFAEDLPAALAEDAARLRAERAVSINSDVSAVTLPDEPAAAMATDTETATAAATAAATRTATSAHNATASVKDANATTSATDTTGPMIAGPVPVSAIQTAETQTDAKRATAAAKSRAAAHTQAPDASFRDGPSTAALDDLFDAIFETQTARLEDQRSPQAALPKEKPRSHRTLWQSHGVAKLRHKAAATASKLRPKAAPAGDREETKRAAAGNAVTVREGEAQASDTDISRRVTANAAVAGSILTAPASEAAMDVEESRSRGAAAAEVHLQGSDAGTSEGTAAATNTVTVREGNAHGSETDTDTDEGDAAWADVVGTEAEETHANNKDPKPAALADSTQTRPAQLPVATYPARDITTDSAAAMEGAAQNESRPCTPQATSDTPPPTEDLQSPGYKGQIPEYRVHADAVPTHLDAVTPPSDDDDSGDDAWATSADVTVTPDNEYVESAV